MEVEPTADDANLSLPASNLVAEIQSYLLVKNSSTNQLERYGICSDFMRLKIVFMKSFKISANVYCLVVFFPASWTDLPS